MNWYNGNRELWKQIIETVSGETKRNPLIIEKDIIQSMFLFELSASSLPFVFKGGTSLSKSYDIIDRFSEDIDLSMSRKITSAERKATKEIIIRAATSLGLNLKNPMDVFSRYDYNQYIFEYKSFFEDALLELIVETNFYQISYPVNKMAVKSHVGKFCDLNSISFPINCNAIQFEMDVQSLERTFIDKIFAVCDYRIENMMDRDSRHLYDIAKIVPLINLNEDLKNLIIKVRNDRMKSKNNPSADPKYNIDDLLKEIITSHFYEKDYRDITQKLLYENVNYDAAITNGISKLVDKRLFD